MDYLLHELAYFDVYFGINRWRRLQGRSKVVPSTQSQHVYYPGNSIPSTPVVCPNELMWNQSCEYSLITQDDPGQCVINFNTWTISLRSTIIRTELWCRPLWTLQ